MKPLEGMIVLDFSQYLAGPSAALRLADLGARVIKIERPGSGDGSRPMKLHNLESMGDSVLYQTIVPHKTNSGVRPAARRIFVLRNRHSAVSAAKVTVISTKAIKRRVLL